MLFHLRAIHPKAPDEGDSRRERRRLPPRRESSLAPRRPRDRVATPHLRPVPAASGALLGDRQQVRIGIRFTSAVRDAATSCRGFADLRLSPHITAGISSAPHWHHRPQLAGVQGGSQAASDTESVGSNRDRPTTTVVMSEVEQPFWTRQQSATGSVRAGIERREPRGSYRGKN